MERELDNYLAEWAKKRNRKPLLLRGARQTGKSHAVEKLGSAFGNYICINFEKTPSSGDLFVQDLDPKRITREIEAFMNRKSGRGRACSFLMRYKTARAPLQP